MKCRGALPLVDPSAWGGECGGGHEPEEANVSSAEHGDPGRGRTAEGAMASIEAFGAEALNEVRGAPDDQTG